MTFFRGVRVLVTGHTGFKGGWLCEWLLEDGANLAGIALAPDAQGSLFQDLDLAGRMRSHLCDIRDYAAVARIIEEERPEIIFHLAAQPLVRRAYANPIETFGTNVMGTVHVLEAARHCESIRAIVCVTSDKCYENREWVWGYRETDALGGKDPYSASKGAAEVVAGSYIQTIFSQRGQINMATTRGGNVVGGGDWSQHRLVPDLVRAMQNGKPLVLRNPNAIRPWQHVLELVRGYVVIGEKLLTEGQRFQGGWNFGPRQENEVTVADLVSRFVRTWGGQAGFEVKIEPSPLKEAQFLKLDIAKSAALLNWRPKLSFEETAELTVAWYQDRFNNPTSARATTRSQLLNYRAH